MIFVLQSAALFSLALRINDTVRFLGFYAALLVLDIAWVAVRATMGRFAGHELNDINPWQVGFLDAAALAAVALTLEVNSREELSTNNFLIVVLAIVGIKVVIEYRVFREFYFPGAATSTART